MRLILLAAATMFATPVSAEIRDLCVDRPGLGTPSCTIDPGHIIVELGVADWTLDRQPDARNDTILSGDLLVRYGLDESMEAFVGWTGYGHSRTRDNASGSVTRAAGVGDVIVGLKRSVSGSNGPVAIQGFVTLPTGSDGIGAGDWGAGLLVPVEIDLGSHFSLDLTPEIDAAVDQDGSGRHVAFGSVVGVSIPVTEKLAASVELSAFRDLDPDVHSTTSLSSLSFGYQTDANTQIDLGAVAGLNRTTPDFELYFGISRRF